MPPKILSTLVHMSCIIPGTVVIIHFTLVIKLCNMVEFTLRKRDYYHMGPLKVEHFLQLVTEEEVRDSSD